MLICVSLSWSGRIRHGWEERRREGGNQTGEIRLAGWRERGMARRRFINLERRRKMAKLHKLVQVPLHGNSETMKKRTTSQISKVEGDVMEIFHERRKRMTIKNSKRSSNGPNMDCLMKFIVSENLSDVRETSLENFDKKALRQALRKKEKSVGEVVLVEGKPALIKKRIVGGNGEIIRRYKPCK